MNAKERVEKIVGMLLHNPQAQGYDGLREQIATLRVAMGAENA